MKLSSTRIVVIVVLLAGATVAQVATGTPPFGSFGGGPFDTVNLGNLNVHWAIPVLHKAGRGMPFTYDLTYDSLVWIPVVSSGTTGWQPAANWGWAGVTQITTGWVSDPVQGNSYSCFIAHNRLTYSVYTLAGSTYLDKFGSSHYFTFNPAIMVGGSGCPNAPQVGPSASGSALATDGSGLTLNVTMNYFSYNNQFTVTASLQTPSGKLMNVPVGSSSGQGTATDENGNQITVNSSAQFFDTLSSTTQVLSVTGSGTPSSPKTFTYVAPSGANASYTMNYVQYTVRTNFGFGSAIAEYGPLSNALVSSISLPDGTSYSFAYEKTPGSCTPLSGTWQTNCVTGRIASVTLPTGGTITYTYSGGTNNTGIYSDGSTANLNRLLSTSTTCSASTNCWQYTRNLLSGTPGPGSTWKTTVIDPNSDYTVINLAEDATTTTGATVATYDFYETQRQVYQGSVAPANLLGTTIRCYNNNYSNCATAQVSSPISRTDFYSQMPNNQTRLSETLYNIYGLVTDDKEYDYGVVTGSAPGTSHLVRETATTYNTTLGNGIVNRPASVTISDWSTGTATTIASTNYYYDGLTPTATTGTPQHIAITGSRGNLTTLTVYTAMSSSLTRQFTYYDTGMLNNSTDVDLGSATCSSKPSICTTYNYSSASCGNSFVTSISEPMGLSRSMTWSCTGGVTTQATDENQKSVSTNYTDAHFWRPANTYDQLNNETTISYIGQTGVESALVNFNGGNSTSDTRSTVDGYGRAILTQRLQGPGSTNYDTVETDYNNVGLPYQTTMPFVAAAGTTSSIAPRTTTGYDALGRPLTITDANSGLASYTYTNNDVLLKITGTQAFQKQLEYDGLGRLTSVCEISQATGSGTCGQSSPVTGFWTKYTYDAVGHLLTVNQNAQAASGSRQSRSYAFDELGRITSESNPETGTVTYMFDRADSTCSSYLSAGNLIERKDGMGNVTCLQYDAAHRVTQMTYPSGTYASSTPTKCFVYDSATVNGNTMANAKTHLVEAYTTTGSSCPGTASVDEGFSYTARGELADVWEKTADSGGWYHVNATYWANGALDMLNGGSSPLPGLPAITYGASDGSGLDGEGRVTKVTTSSGQSPLVNSVTYNNGGQTNQPIGALTGTVLGSTTAGTGDSDSYSYDTNTGRLLQYQFNMGTAPQSQTGALTWNTNGTLQKLQITDQINTANSQTCTFGYDDLVRVNSANCGSSWSQTFGFDPFGNLSKTGSAQFLPTYTGTSGTNTAPTNQYYQIPGGSSGTSNYYDTNGNLTNDLVHTYSWDANGNLLKIDSTAVVLTYDALDRVVEQTRGSNHTEVVYSPVGAKLALMNGQALVSAFAALPGGGTAVYSSGGLAYYRHPDHLGSSRLATTPSRAKYYDVAYAPYGEDYNGSGTTDLSFTGQNQDTVTGGWTSNVYDFLMREYRTGHGRWISPDPAGMGAVNPITPQTWNRYAYALNNPLGFIDPLGTQVMCSRCQGSQGGPPGSSIDASAMIPGGGSNVFSAALNGGLILQFTAVDVPDGNWYPIVTDQGVNEIQGFETVWQISGLSAFSGPGNEPGGGPDPVIAEEMKADQALVSAINKWTHCAGQALAAKGLSIALDVLGAIPAVGNLVSGTAAGIRAGDAFLSGTGALSGAGLVLLNPNDPVDTVSGVTNLGLAATNIVLGGTKAIPLVGNAVSVLTLGWDTYQAYKTYHACMAKPD